MSQNAILSMTGFGQARLQEEHRAIEVEIRTVNNRHFKLTARISEPYAALEAEFEKLIRQKVRRGTVQLNLRVDTRRRPEDYRLNPVALTSYRDQLVALRGSGLDRASDPVDLSALLSLPGVVEEIRARTSDPHEDWPVLSRVVREALDRLTVAREADGRSMAEELKSLGESLDAGLSRIETRGPVIVEGYRDRLLERVRNLVRDLGVTVEARDLVREVAIFAERSDIAEEVVRLRAHIRQFLDTLRQPAADGVGRTLEFVVQEMGRETNTIGSKANDVEISVEVVALKGALEKVRELIQNVE